MKKKLEIRRGTIIPRAAIRRLVNPDKEHKFSKKAMHVLHVVAEHYLIGLVAKAKEITVHPLRRLRKPLNYAAHELRQEDLELAEML
jgi:histone H3/H4